MTKQIRLFELGTRSGLKVNRISMGAMRFPSDLGQAVELIRYGIDSGMKYIDTSRGYADSELKLAAALKDGYRAKVYLSTKWAPWVKKYEADDNASAECTYRRILDSMSRLEVDYLDFYQIWNIFGTEQWELATQKGGMLDGIMRAKKEGLVRHIGFTTHDKPENIARYIDEADWCEVILFTYNMFNQQYRDVIAKAHQKGIGTIVMNPAGGGMFKENSPVMLEIVKSIVGDGVGLIEAGHRFLSADENVDTIVCGITDKAVVDSTIENFAKVPLGKAQVDAITKAFAALSRENMHFCTGCKYCMPCPQGIDIPSVMHAVYLAKLLKCPGAGREFFSWIVNPENENRSSRPESCVQCGRCESQCTQRLRIIEELAYAIEHFD